MKRISRRNFLKAMGISATALTLAACGGSSSSTAAGTAGSTAASAVATGEPKAGGTLRLCYSSPIATPGYTPRATGNAAIYYLTLSYESLTSYDAEGNMIPNLATEWDVNTDELSITWTLREGVNFADGEPFNAEAVKRNIEEYQANNRTETANTAFQANEYDMYWVGLANPTILQQLDGAGIYVKEDNQNGMGVESLGLIPNSAIDGPWADARVRRALCYAIDVDAINAAFLMGMAQMTDQWAVPGSATYNDSLNHFTYDPEKAKSLLAEAGYADGFTTNIVTISGMSDMLTAIANMLDEVGIHCNIQQVDGATNNQYMKDGTWEGLMLHFATIAPDLGLYMGRHLDKNGAYYAKGIQHPDKEMELLEEIRRCMDPDEKHKLEKELQAAIYDAEDGSCLFGRVLYVNKSSMYKYDYVIDDHATEAFTACWDLSACWLNK